MRDGFMRRAFQKALARQLCQCHCQTPCNHSEHQRRLFMMMSVMMNSQPPSTPPIAMARNRLSIVLLVISFTGSNGVFGRRIDKLAKRGAFDARNDAPGADLVDQAQRDAAACDKDG